MEEIDSIAPQVKDDERLLLLYWALSEPLTMDQMIKRGFLGKTGLKHDSYERAFRRMKQDLDDNGIHLEEVQRAGQSAWRVNRQTTYMEVGPLSPDAVLRIVMILEAYLSSHDPSDLSGSQAYLDLLRRAHDKLAVESGDAGRLIGSACTDKALAQGWSDLLGAYVDRRGVAFAYRDAHGNVSRRNVDVYGVFQHGEHLFFVAYDHIKDGIRVFRDDRVDAGSVCVSKRTFEVPQGFSVQDHMGLPFEYGSDQAHTVFQAKGDPQAARRLTRGRGAWHDGNWEVEVSDVAAGARWACGAMQRAGLVPQGPGPLHDELAQGLRKVLAQHG